MLPSTTCNWIGFVLPLFLGAFALVIALLVLGKYVNRKTPILKTLFFLILFLAGAVLADPIFYYLELDFSMNSTIPFALSAVANVFLVRFIVLVFLKEKRHGWLHALAVAEIGVAILTPLVPVLSLFDGDLLPVLLLHVVASAIIYLTLVNRAIAVRESVARTERVSRVGMSFMAYTGVLLVFTFVVFVMQELPSLVPEFNAALQAIGFAEGGCTYFVVIGWFLASLAAATLYIGYVMPGWVRRLLERA